MGMKAGSITNQVNEISREDFEKITQSNLNISSDLVNYITTKDDLLFPILIGSDLRALKVLKHQFEGESLRPKKSKKALTDTAYLFLNAPYLWEEKHYWASIARVLHKWFIRSTASN